MNELGVSVIIPTCNDSDTLNRAIESVKDEKCVSEIYLVDDASNEDHAMGVGWLADWHGCGLEINSVNYGLAGARNRGIERAKCKWIFVLDADDYVYQNGIDGLYFEAKKNEYDIIYGCITDRYPQTDPRHHIAKPKENITKDDFLVDNPLFCSSLFTKEIWRRAGGYTSRGHSFYEDYDYFAKCFSVGAQFKYVNCLVYHHTNDQKPSMLDELHKNTNEYKKLSQQGLNYGENKKCYVPKFVNIDGKTYIEV
jgi:succinoglycan biosynthesis protein ExoO